jgi:hypothetical protein
VEHDLLQVEQDLPMNMICNHDAYEHDLQDFAPSGKAKN